MPSLNGKISEYAAAVGLAGLDTWKDTRADFWRVAQAYRQNLSGQAAMRLQTGLGENWIASTVIVESQNDDIELLVRVLEGRGIGTRRWWGGGLSRHRAFAHCPQTMTRQTDLLADSTVGLPCYRDLADEEIAEICEIIVTGRRTR
jgi:dTDP-4-amino-4,6-dideoxygalactose transaminase